MTSNELRVAVRLTILRHCGLEGLLLVLRKIRDSRKRPRTIAATPPIAGGRDLRCLSELEYPFHDRTIAATMCGRVCVGSRKINLSTAFAGQNIGVKEVDEKVWLISFMHYDLGFFDHESSRFECAQNPFAAKV